ncbi:hypothetical protein [Protofrankia symbiont of Coriaria ruscifolia]|uniref:Putative membrane protein n=1 Tax=Candidatus Protofrankia californiensis TaxID=1839754 RepID=A0A1C3PFU9_9ACTN|nr:hypothetical protein [Protofrankia symbiont of Coriaria ruscifolia]SBW28701.1 putative membrane protein [Candidatus Protofrankia californiensis]
MARDDSRKKDGSGKKDAAANPNRVPQRRTPIPSGGPGTRPGQSARRPGPDLAPPDLRVQLPYFAARIAALLVVLAILLILSVNPILALLAGLVIVGVLTYPLGRLQRKAAQRAAGRADAGPRSSAGPARR